MIKLANGCTCSEPKVFPNNWKLQKASVKKDWYIFYRYYDPNSSSAGKGKLILKKGMNHFKLISERQAETERLLTEELSRLRNEGYNSLQSTSAVRATKLLQLDSNTPFINALEIAEKNIQGSISTKRDLKSILRFVSNADAQSKLEQNEYLK